MSRKVFTSEVKEALYTDHRRASVVTLLPSWSLLDVTGLGFIPRSGHTAVVVGQNEIWVSGGYGGERGSEAILDDIICLSINDDKKSICVRAEVPVSGKEARVGHSAVRVSDGQKHNVYVFGGWNGKQYLNFGYLLDLEAKHLLPETHTILQTPDGRRDHSTVIAGRKIVVFGGWNINEQFNDVWFADKFEWRWGIAEVSGDIPAARRGHSATVIGNKMYVFGGIFGFSKYLDELYVLNLDTWEWTVPDVSGDSPSCRAWHSACRIGNTGQILIFGGTAGRMNFYNDMYVLDTASMQWFPIPYQNADSVPAGRCAHTAVMIGSKMYVIGGLSPSVVDNRILPTGDIFVMETGLDVDETAPQDTDVASGITSESEANIGGDQFESTQKTQALVDLSSLGDQVVEGWLSVLTPAIKADKEDVWLRRFFKLLGTDLCYYQTREKGTCLIRNGLVKDWSEEWEKKEIMLPVDGDDDDPSSMTLEDILSNRSSSQCKQFIYFSESRQCAELPSFYLDVEDFRSGASTSDGMGLMSAATVIRDTYIQPGSDKEIQCDPDTRTTILTQIDEANVTKDMFDLAQKQCLSVMRSNIMMDFSDYLLNRAESFTLKTAMTEADKEIPYCDNCLSKFSFSRRRNFCRLCGSVYCGSCISHSITLPEVYGAADPVRVCDVCNSAFKQRAHTFSLVLKNRNRPLNLQAHTAEDLEAWKDAFRRSLALTGEVDIVPMSPAASTSSLKSPPTPSSASSRKVKPSSTPTAGTSTGTDDAGSPEVTSDIVHLEGWVRKEDPTSKQYRDRYFVLHHNRLYYYQMTLQERLPISKQNNGSIDHFKVVRQTLVESNANVEDGTPPHLKGGFLPGSHFSYRFEVSNNVTMYKLASETEADRLRWINAIHKATNSKAKSQDQIETLQLARSLAMGDDQSGSMVALNAPQGEVAFACGVVDSMRLWEAEPNATNEALHICQDIMMNSLRNFSGYVVKKELSSYVFAFHSSVDALQWCATVQRSLLGVEWPSALGSIGDTEKVTDKEGNVIYNGLRIAFAVHKGFPDCRKNAVVNQMKYSGPTLDEVQALVRYAHGGQTLCLQDCYSDVKDTLEDEGSDEKDAAHLESAEDAILSAQRLVDVSELVFNDVGSHVLRGVNSESVTVYEVVCADLQQRQCGNIKPQPSLSHADSQSFSQSFSSLSIASSTM